MSAEPRTGRFKFMAKSALSVGVVGDAVRMMAAVRGRSLVFVYHRVVRGTPSRRGVVPVIPSDVFQRQVEALAEVGEIRPLGALLEERDRHARPRFALTFDDDFVEHAEHVVPILRAIGASATFFLSGRALLGLGTYWFERLDRLIDARGEHEVRRLLDVGSPGVDALIAACENDPALQRVVEGEVPEDPCDLDRSSIEAIHDAGFDVGFHTLRHQILTRLADGELEAALTEGRRELEQVVGRSLLHLAYPHGKADERTAASVRDAGFTGAWTGRPTPMQRRSDPYILGRWEPGPLGVDDLLVGVAVKLTRGEHR
jgi:peptidoglycan/xylan/chitin deacetylase (PgdA/CDA1 family)